MTASRGRIDSDELFGRLTETAEVYADCPPELTFEEKGLAVTIAKRVTATRLLDLWAGYLARKPGKKFRWFVEDCAAEIRDAQPALEPVKFQCSQCHRKVTAGLYFEDSGLCADCERAACVPDGQQQLHTILSGLTGRGAVEVGS